MARKPKPTEEPDPNQAELDDPMGFHPDKFKVNIKDIVPLFYGDVYVDPLAQYGEMTDAEFEEYEKKLGEELAAEEKARGG